MNFARKMFMNKFILCILLVFFFNTAFPQATIKTNSTENSIGFYVENYQNYFSARISVKARFKEGTQSWRNCITPSLINYPTGGKTIAGSVLQAKTGTSYQIEVTIYDSTTNANTILSTQCNTKTIFTIPISKDTLWLSTNGTGNYTFSNPGNIKKLFNQESFKLDSGTCVIFKPGTYYVGDLKDFNLLPCNNPNFPIVFIAQTPGTVTLDGSENNKTAWSTWQLYDTIKKIYRATLSDPVAFSTELLMDGNRLFPYAYINDKNYTIWNPLPQSVTYRESLSSLWYGSGFFRNGKIYYIKLQDGSSPMGKEITVSKRNILFRFTNTNNSKQTLIFKNLNFRHFSKPIMMTDLTNGHYAIPAVAVVISDIQNSVFTNCNFSYNTQSLVFSGNCSGALIQNCSFKDQTGGYSQMAYKNTSLTTSDLFFLSGKEKMGRSLEFNQVSFNAIKSYNSIIIKDNIFDNVLFSISGNLSSSCYAQDIDIYGNKFLHNFGPIGTIGTSINYRIWNNYFSNAVYNFSPVCSPNGPIFMFRNVFDSIAHRRGNTIPPKTGMPATQNGMFDCNWNYLPVLEGSLFKWNVGQTACPTVKQYFDLHFYHNTVVATNTFAMNIYMLETVTKNFNSANNNYYSLNKNLKFDAKNPDPTFTINSQHDNFFSTTNELAEIVRPNPGNNNPCEKPSTLSTVKTRLRQLYAVSDTNLIQFNSFQNNPLHVSNNDYHLQNNSPESGCNFRQFVNII